jgi:hypothetical protein
MKKLLIIFFLLIPAANVFSQGFRVEITYSEGERSKDSPSSKTINISVNGREAVLTAKTDGREDGGLEVNEKIVLRGADLNRIKTLSSELPLSNSPEGSESLWWEGQFRSLSVSINKEDKIYYAFYDTVQQAENDETYKKFFKN